MLGELLKATVGLVVQTPLALAADVITMGGAMTDQNKPYTVQALENVYENVEKAVKDSND